VTLLALVVELVLASTLLIAASQKALAADAWNAARSDLGIDLPYAVWRALPVGEAVVGIALGIGLRPWAGAAALVLFASFGVVLTIAFRAGVRTDCNCFGRFLPTKVGPVAIGRAFVLALASVVLVLIANEAEPGHPLGLVVPVTAAAIASLYSSVRPLLSN
jgi:uncharacterized membrane protein YphA (DoxX/SURF4 family)